MVDRQRLVHRAREQLGPAHVDADRAPARWHAVTIWIRARRPERSPLHPLPRPSPRAQSAAAGGGGRRAGARARAATRAGPAVAAPAGARPPAHLAPGPQVGGAGPPRLDPALGRAVRDQRPDRARQPAELGRRRPHLGRQHALLGRQRPHPRHRPAPARRPGVQGARLQLQRRRQPQRHDHAVADRRRGLPPPLDPARHAGVDPRLRPDQDQRRLRLRRPGAGHQDGRGVHRAEDQPRDHRQPGRLPAVHRRDRRDRREDRPRVLRHKRGGPQRRLLALPEPRRAPPERNPGAHLRPYARKQVQPRRQRPHPRPAPAADPQRDQVQAALPLHLPPPPPRLLGRTQGAAHRHGRPHAPEPVHRLRARRVRPRPRAQGLTDPRLLGSVRVAPGRAQRRGSAGRRMRAAPLGACRALLAGGAAIAAASAIALPSAARGAGRPVRAAGTVRAAATVRALPTRSGRPAGTASRPRVVPLLFRAPRPATLGRRSSRSAEGTRTAGPAPSAPAAGVFGATLDQPGLSAAGELSLVSPPGVTPPDSTGAIGPTAYIEIVNSQIAIWSRADLTTMVASSGLDSFTGGTSTCDPQIRFDPQSGRWFYSALRCDMTPNQNQLYVGWSKTADPTTLGPSDWCTYTIPTTPSTSLDDYDKLGIDGGHVIIGANLFTASSLQFQTAQILVAAKPPAGTITSCGPAPVFTVFGSPSSPLRTSIGNLAFTPEPATVSDGTWAAGYVVAADFDDPQDVSGSHLMLWRVGDSGPHPSLTAAGDVPVSPFSAPARGVAQPSGGDPIDPLDGRLTQAVMSLDPNVSGATEAIWTQHTVDDGSGGTEVRWYEVVPSTLGEHAHGTVTSPAGFAFNGAIAPTLSGGAVIDFNTGGSSQKVDVED